MDGKYFEIVKQTELGQVQAECKLCTKKKNIISGSLSATTNFKVHLKRMHPEAPQGYEQHKKDVIGAKKGKPANTKYKQTKLFSGSLVVQQRRLDELIVSYVVQGMHPLSTAEQKEFIDLIQGLSPHSSVMSRRTLCRRIDCEFDSKISSVKDLLKTTKHLCTTADIWSTSVSSFIGVTAHWVHIGHIGTPVCDIGLQTFSKSTHT